MFIVYCAQINSLKVATALLSAAFFYDIFWVFLSPLIFKESVMIAVATGGGPTEDPTLCEKYPRTKGEQLIILSRESSIHAAKKL